MGAATSYMYCSEEVERPWEVHGPWMLWQRANDGGMHWVEEQGIYVMPADGSVAETNRNILDQAIILPPEAKEAEKQDERRMAGKVLEMATVLFQEADADGSGEIDRQEIVALLEAPK